MEINKITSITDPVTDSASSAVSDTGDFSEYLGSSNTLESIFQKASETYGVSVSLLEAIGMQESGFNANATSRCGAQGIMQLMPSTAASLGVTDSYDAEQNIMGGAKYISSLLAKYDGNVSYALAAYNAGSGNVAKYGGIPPFKETQNYVEKVLGYMANGVTLPDGTVTSGSSTSPSMSVQDPENSSEAAASLSELLFTYEDYLRFLDLYMDTLSESAKEEKESEQEADKETSASRKDNYYAYQDIKFNNSIMNLLNTTDV